MELPYTIYQIANGPLLKLSIRIQVIIVCVFFRRIKITSLT